MDIILIERPTAPMLNPNRWLGAIKKNERKTPIMPEDTPIFLINLVRSVANNTDPHNCPYV